MLRVSLLIGALLVIEGCAAGRAISDGGRAALQSVGLAAGSEDTANDMKADASDAQTGHWSEEWVWRGDSR